MSVGGGRTRERGRDTNTVGEEGKGKSSRKNYGSEGGWECVCACGRGTRGEAELSTLA